MFKKKTKKDLYNESLFDLRTYINGETAIKPYWYLRNGLLHVRYNVDRCVKLSDSEVAELKLQLTASPAEKQSILEKAWKFFTDCVEKPIINDGVAEIEKQIKEYNRHGFKN